MRIASVHIEHFRCLEDVTLGLDDLTVLIGANGSGKSSVLHALGWFFDGGPLDIEDVTGRQPDRVVSVSVTFGDLSDADREALGSYATGATATFWRIWSVDEGEKLTGRGLAFPPFEAIRSLGKAGEIRTAYSNLRSANPDLGLRPVTSGSAALDALKAWEAENRDRLEMATTSASHLFGFVGRPKLAGRFDYVLVPAVCDAEEQTRDARGTLLSRLLERSSADQARADERFEAVRAEFENQARNIAEEEYGGALRRLSEHVTGTLRAYVESGGVSLAPRPPQLRTGPLGVDMVVTDGGLETQVTRQGHGFQRALLIAIVQELALTEAEGDVPGIFLAIEEPELYQHPAQARHFAAVLAQLAAHRERVIQVALATHSPYFIDPASYERLRRFRKRPGLEGYATAEITAATVASVAARLRGIVDEREIALRMGITIRRTLSEAMFARAVLIVEGATDAAVFSGIADRHWSFDAAGIAVVPAGRKTLLPIAWAIVNELDIPTFVIFDGDAGVRERMERDGKSAADIDRAVADTARQNRQLLAMLGAAALDWPETAMTAAYAVFADRLESELQATWPAVLERVDAIARETADWRGKSEDAYREAARETAGDVPEFWARVVAAIRAVN